MLYSVNNELILIFSIMAYVGLALCLTKYYDDKIQAIWEVFVWLTQIYYNWTPDKHLLRSRNFFFHFKSQRNSLHKELATLSKYLINYFVTFDLSHGSFQLFSVGGFLFSLQVWLGQLWIIF